MFGVPLVQHAPTKGANPRSNKMGSLQVNGCQLALCRIGRPGYHMPGEGVMVVRRANQSCTYYRDAWIRTPYVKPTF